MQVFPGVNYPVYMYKILQLGKRTWPILFIVIACALLRIYKIEELFYFTYDESIPAFVGRRLILWHHLPLIGGVTPFGFHITPYFYWFLGLLLSTSKLNPLIWGYAGAFISMLTVFMIYQVGKNLGNKKLALCAAALWAFSTLANIYDRHFWALYWGPLLSLIYVYCLYKIVKGSEKFTYVLALASIIGISTDPSNLVFIALSAFVWIVFKIPFKKSTFVSIALVLFSLLPIIAFDLKHNFANSKPILSFVDKGANKPGFTAGDFYDHLAVFPNAFVRLIYTFGDNQIAKQYSYCQNFVSEKYAHIPIYLTFLTTAILIYFLYWSYAKNKNYGWAIVSHLLIFYFLGIQLYGTVFKADIFEHYLTGVFPLFMLILAKFVSVLPKKTWLIFIFLFAFFNLQKLSQIQNSHGLKNKRFAIEYTVNNVGAEPFSLESQSTCWRFSGYRYLFAIFGKEPVKSYVDPNLGYLYGTTPISVMHPDTVVTFITHDFENEKPDFYKRYALYKSHQKANSIFGNIEVIIMDNKEKWF